MNAEKIISGDSPERNGKCQSASRNEDACERKNKTSIRTYTHKIYDKIQFSQSKRWIYFFILNFLLSILAYSDLTLLFFTFFTQHTYFFSFARFPPQSMSFWFTMLKLVTTCNRTPGRIDSLSKNAYNSTSIALTCMPKLSTIQKRQTRLYNFHE